MNPRKFLFGMLLVCLCFSSLCTEKKEIVDGGGCSYNTFHGSCTIVKTDVSQHAIYFSFAFDPSVSVDRPTKDEYSNKTFVKCFNCIGLGCLKGSYEPTMGDLESCDVLPGEVFDCSMSLEVSGSCTPDNFDFVDKAPDYRVGTCDEKCKNKGYQSSYCSVSKIPSEYRCDAGDYRLSELTSDCMGAGTACCCKGKTSVDCAKEGETIITSASSDKSGPTECCLGLTPDDGYLKPDAQGNCPPSIPLPLPAKETCIKCGDGICGAGENKCNCPQDCNNTADCSSSSSADSCAKAGGKWGLTPEGYRCACPFTPEQIAACEKVCKAAGTTYVNCDYGLMPSGSVLIVSGKTFCCCKNLATNSTCGDGFCREEENSTNCPQDCGNVAASCGNGKCEAGETTTNCPTDCPCVAEGRSMPVFAVSPGGFDMQRQTGKFECCPGLKTVSNQVRPYEGICAGIVGVSGGDVCVKCGDGTCGAGENFCNCHTDCSLPRCFKEGENYSMEATNRNYCCEGLKNVENLVPLSSGRCSYGYSEYVCTKCGDGTCGVGENYCNCPSDCPKCASEGAMMKSGGPEGADLPDKCCDGLTPYTRGGSEWVMEAGCVKKNYSSVPIGYWCIKCGDGICNRDGGEDLCSCPQDCVAEGQPKCNSSSDCVLAIYPDRCCTCPQAIHSTMLDGKEAVLYQKGMNISAVLPSICDGMFCYPCPTVREAICHSGKCVASSMCGNAFCEPGENESSCPSDCELKQV